MLVILGISSIRAATEPLRDRAGVNNWMQAAYRSLQVVGHHLTRVGQALAGRKSVGEIAAVGGDAMALAHIYYMIGGLVASTVSYAVVAVILLRASPVLGLFVLIGVPVFSGVMFLLGKPLKKRQSAQREASGEMTALGADVVAGLRILRGIGGEEHYLRRYGEASDITRKTGTAIAMPVAAIEALEVLVAGILVVGLTWIGALQAIHGQLLPGELVTFYGYAGFLVMPITLASHAVATWTRSLIAAEKLLSVLDIDPAATDSTDARPAPAAAAPLVDSTSGVTIRPGTSVGNVAADPGTAAALLDRLARFDDAILQDAPVVWADRSITTIRLPDTRSRISLADPEPHFFTGTLRSELDPSGRHGDADIVDALHTAGADDILEALPDGLDTITVERGRAFSGGQRQRLGLARALLTDAETLLLVEPTSAVDAHTEQRIADRLSTARGGRSTVLATSSPLLLRALDQVYLLADGAVVANGSHHQLMDDPRYRAVVLRGGE